MVGLTLLLYFVVPSNLFRFMEAYKEKDIFKQVHTGFFTTSHKFSIFNDLDCQKIIYGDWKSLLAFHLCKIDPNLLISKYVFFMSLHY